MKELERYLGTTNSDSCQPAIMTETSANFPDPEMSTITELGTERSKTDGDMTYLEKNNIDEAIRQKLRQGRCTYLEGYNFDLGPRASDKFAITMKELEQYLGTTYSDICQPAIMTETAANFPDPEMSTITELGTERPKTDGEMTYL